MGFVDGYVWLRAIGEIPADDPQACRAIGLWHQRKPELPDIVPAASVERNACAQRLTRYGGAG